MKNYIKFGIKGAYGERNFGDDALMIYLLKWSKNNDLDPFFIGKKANYLKKYLPLERYLLVNNFHKYNFKTLIFGGGTQFFSFKNNSQKSEYWKLVYSNPILFIKKLLLFIEKKLFLGQPRFDNIFSVGIGLGPFVRNSERELLAKKQLSIMKGVYVRDKFSFEFSKNINQNTYLATDICFLPNILNFKPYFNKSIEVKRIGIIVRDWEFSKEGSLYFERVLEEADKLISYSYVLDFILFRDEPMCELELNNSNHRIIKWNPDNQNLDDFLKVLSNYDLFISSRFHGVIFGALLNIPSIAIEIEPKLRVTKELLGKGVSIWEQPFSEDLLLMIDRINYIEAKESLTIAVRNQEMNAVKMFDNLLREIRQVTQLDEN